MNKYSCPLLAMLAGALVIGLAAGPCLSAQTRQDNPAIHKDGTATAKQKKITQADRQAAANRAKAKGFVAPTIEETATTPADALQTKGGVK